jgi:hypothetical protein
MTLSAEQRRALEMLADAGARGSILDTLIVNGFPAELLADLVHDGVVTIHDETVKASDLGSRSSVFGSQKRARAQSRVESHKLDEQPDVAGLVDPRAADKRGTASADEPFNIGGQ